MKKNKETTVLIGVPNGSGQFPAKMVSSLLQLQKTVPCAFMVVERQMIEKARNAIALEALKVGATHLLFVDDDNPIPPDTLTRLLEADKDVVIAPILGRNPNKDGIHPLCAFYSFEHEGVTLYKHIEEFRDKGPLHKIDAGGTGCMLIKREVLEKMFVLYQDRMFERTYEKLPKKIKVDGVEFEARSMSEDCEFSERVVKAGFEIWLDDRVRPYHITEPKLIQY